MSLEALPGTQEEKSAKSQGLKYSTKPIKTKLKGETFGEKIKFPSADERRGGSLLEPKLVALKDEA